MWKCHTLRWEFKFSAGNVKSALHAAKHFPVSGLSGLLAIFERQKPFYGFREEWGKMWWCWAASWLQNQANSACLAESHLRAWHASKIAYHLSDVLISKVWGSSEDIERHIQKVEIAGESLPEGYRGDGLNSVSLVWSGGKKEWMCQILEKLP